MRMVACSVLLWFSNRHALGQGCIEDVAHFVKSILQRHGIYLSKIPELLQGAKSCLREWRKKSPESYPGFHGAVTLS